MDCYNSQFDIFTRKIVNNSVIDSERVEGYPVAPIGDTNPVSSFGIRPPPPRFSKACRLGLGLGLGLALTQP